MSDKDTCLDIITKRKKQLDENIKNIIAYCTSLIGKPYVWWKGGRVWSEQNTGPIWSHDSPPPDIKEIETVNCVGLVNLGLRSLGLPLPVAKNGTKGGTLAYQETYEKVAEPFDSKKMYSVGTLIGRRYQLNPKDQGHIGIIIENNYVLQSCHPDGVNNGYTLQRANEWHDGDYYHYVVSPDKWLIKIDN
jgi:hypothetical protein